MAEPSRYRLEREALHEFLGVNLRRDAATLRDQDLARAINADLHRVVGSPTTRRGRALLASYTPAGRVRVLQTVSGERYLIHGQVLRRGSTTLTSALSARELSSLVAVRPATDTTTWVFLGDYAGMQKTNGTSLTTWGIAAPTAAPAVAAGAAGSLSGVYTLSYTYVRKVGSAVAHESNPSPTSAAVTVSGTTVSVSGLTDASDSQVTHKRLYRTVNGGSTRLYDQEIVQGTTTATSRQADTGLGSAVDTANDPPPVAPILARHQEHVFFVGQDDHPEYLWWSKRYRPESVPSPNFLRIGTPSDPLNGLVSLAGILGVFTRLTKYRLLGNDTAGFVHQEALSARGTPAPQAALATERGCLFVARDGIFRTNFFQEDTEMSGLIAPLFEGQTVQDYLPINWEAAPSMTMAYYKQRLYWAYPSGEAATPDMVAVYSWQTEQWFFYALPVTALYHDEATDALLAGDDAARLWQLESGTTDDGAAVQMILEPATRVGGDALRRKRFDYLRLDVVSADAVTCALYIDDTLTQRLTLTPTTRREVHRLNGTQGYTWRVVLTFSGPGTLHDLEMLYVNLEKA